MSHKRQKTKSTPPASSSGGFAGPGTPGEQRALKVVLKADTWGTLEALAKAVERGGRDGGGLIDVIEQGVGAVSKSDLSMALTGSRLVVGFDVGVLERVEDFARDHGVEVRLYNLIDRAAQDLSEVVRSLSPAPPEEKIVGQARVIALFKSTRKGTILGCEVFEGKLTVGNPFRVIDPAGPIYQGKIESLHIAESAVQHARPGQKVGVKISDFKQGRVGDLVECYEAAHARPKVWTPRPGVFRVADS